MILSECFLYHHQFFFVGTNGINICSADSLFGLLLWWAYRSVGGPAESPCKTLYLCNCEHSWIFGGYHCFCLLWKTSCLCCWPWHQADHQRNGWHEGCNPWRDPPVRNGTQPSASPPSSPPNQCAGCKLPAVQDCGSSLSPARSPLHYTHISFYLVWTLHM